MAESKQLVAIVGTNIDKRRYEPGDVIDAPLEERQRRYLIAEGYAFEIKAGTSEKRRQALLDEHLPKEG